MTFEVRAIRPEDKNELEACLNLWGTVFPFDGGRSESDPYFRRYFEGDLDWIPDYTQVGLWDGKPVSAVHIVKRVVSMPDFTLTFGGIANVATLPEFRGRGYNAACLEAAIRVMEADALDFSLLFTGIPDYYRKFGFVPLPLQSFTGELKPELELPASPYLIRPAVPEDLPAIRDLYEIANAHRPLSVRRSAAYWRDWVGAEKPDGLAGILVATKSQSDQSHQPDANLVGYVWAADRLRFADGSLTSPQELTLHEIAVVPDSDFLPTLTLISAATAWASERGATRLRLELSADPAVLAAWETLTENRETRHSTAPMVRLLHRSALPKNLALLATMRHRDAEIPTSEAATLTLETLYGDTEIVSEASRLVVRDINGEKGSNERAKPDLTQSDFFAALFGLTTPTFPNAPEKKRLASLLFPGGAGHYASKDGF